MRPLPLLLILACRAEREKPARPDTGSGGSEPAHTDSADSGAEPAHTDEPAEPDEPAVTQEQVPEADASEPVFDLDHVATIALEMEPADWEDIASDPWAENWHAASFRWDDESVDEVGVRAFGYSSHYVGKPPLKIAFDKVVDGQRWRGLEEIKLDNGYTDPSFLNEALGTLGLRRAGVPAARTGWAVVTVNGEEIGFFQVMESIDDRFLARNFGSDEGPLYSLSTYRGLGLNPITDPEPYYLEDTSVETDFADLIDLSRLVAEGTDEELAAVLDLDLFFTEAVVRALQGSMDCFSCDGNNFYLYNDPSEDADPDDLHGTWRIIPWDFDRDFAQYGVWYALETSPTAPWETSWYAYDPLTGNPYQDPVHQRNQAMGREVDAKVAELFADALAWSRQDEELASWVERIGPYVAADRFGEGWEGRVHDLRLYLHLRASAALGRDAASCPGLSAGWVPAAELSPEGTVGWGTLGVDERDFAGGGCLPDGGPCPGLQVAGEHYCTGLYAHAPSSITLQIPEGCDALSGRVGLVDFAERCSDGASFAIKQDGVLLWSAGPLGNGDAPVDLGGVAVAPGEVVLETRPGASIACDTTAWLDLAARCGG